MSLPIKTTIGVLGLSAVAIPGIWMAVTAEPSSMTLGNSLESLYTGKFGEDFKHHLVDTKEGKNESWWDWSFEYRWKADQDTSKEESFKAITSGSLLREKCEEIYKKENKDLSNKQEGVWRYCSIEGKKPSTVKDSKDASKGDETIGKKHEEKLISTLNTSNNNFWVIQEKAFFKFGENDGLGKKATENSIFKSLYENNARGEKDTLRNKCQEAYEKKESEADADKKYALLFCSLDAKAN